MTQTTSKISVIICAFTEKRWDATIAAIESVKKQTLPADEIILVIDHNPPLLERARADIPDIITIENNEPRGLSGARNSGISVAQGTFIAFLDDDAAAEPDWLAQLDSHCQNPQVLGAGGVVDPLWLGPKPRWFPEEFYWVIGCTYRGLPEKRTTVRNPYGGCTCIRKEVFDIVGGFRNGVGRVGTIPKGCEETELSIRARHHWPQKVFMYEPAARIHHQVPSTRTTWRYFCSRCYGEGISKAAIARFVGAKDGLATERSYTLRTLPLGIWQGFRDTFAGKDVFGLARASAIAVGLLATTTGYLIGSIQQYLLLLQRVLTKKQDQQSLIETSTAIETSHHVEGR